ncbi:MAG: indole-3-glycerol-phosphate synthase [Rubrobacteridae bacterium]|nr:indole-3-glycerol-phosphate synthase [Rubrobacteridae bacterium]
MILDKIVESKIEHIEAVKSIRSLDEISEMAKDAQANKKYDRRSLIDFIREINTSSPSSRIPVIAEIKTKAFGADLILLIAAILSDKQIDRLLGLAHELNLEVLIESHTEEELKRSIKSGAVLQGINNRNLDTLMTELSTTEELLPLVPSDRIVIAESGIKNGDDIARLHRAGAKAFLVGESLLKSNDPGAKLAEMVYAGNSK